MRKALLAAFALLMLFGLTAESCETTTNSTPDASSSSDSKSEAKTAAKVGDTLTLHDSNDNEYKVTLTKFLRNAEGGEFDEPDAGNRFVGVKLTIKNVSEATYSDSPSNGSVLIDTRDDQYDAALLTDGNCELPASVKIAPGDQRRVCIPFEMPKKRMAAKFQFALDSGFSDENGEWSLR